MQDQNAIERVFPTCVGVFLFSFIILHRNMRLPHVRGGVSNSSLCRASGRWSSPRAWGCFRCPSGSSPDTVVFPTCVGVFPSVGRYFAFSLCLPHVRGGVSIVTALSWGIPESSPRAWGCFYKALPSCRAVLVFPTCVGVFPCRWRSSRPASGLPHVRGGVSHGRHPLPRREVSSPRAWGCF